MTNLANNKNVIIDEVVHRKATDRKVIDIHLDEERMGVTLLFDTAPAEFIKVEAPSPLHLSWLRNEACAYTRTFNRPGAGS